MIFRKLTVVLAFILFFGSFSFGAEIGKIYHIKFEWKAEKTGNAFYEMTTYLYESMKDEGIILYAEYGNLNGVHIYISQSESFGKLQKIISAKKNQKIDFVIDLESNLKTPMHKRLSGNEPDKTPPECQFQKTYNFKTADAGLQFRNKLQDIVLRRGYFIGLFYFPKSKTEFDIRYDFFANCISKDAIITELLKIIPENSPH